MADQLNGADPRAVGDVLTMDRGAKELRRIASDLGVSRERGDTKRQTAQRIVDQAPWALEVEWGYGGNPDLFEVRVDREASPPEERVSLEQAVRMAPSDRLEHRLREIDRALMGAAPSYSAEVALGAGLFQVLISSSESHWNRGELGLDRYRAVLTERGGIRGLERTDEATGGGTDFLSGASSRKTAWRSFIDSVERAR